MAQMKDPHVEGVTGCRRRSEAIKFPPSWADLGDRIGEGGHGQGGRARRADSKTAGGSCWTRHGGLPAGGARSRGTTTTGRIRATFGLPFFLEFSRSKTGVSLHEPEHHVESPIPRSIHEGVFLGDEGHHAPGGDEIRFLGANIGKHRVARVGAHALDIVEPDFGDAVPGRRPSQHRRYMILDVAANTGQSRHDVGMTAAPVVKEGVLREIFPFF